MAGSRLGRRLDFANIICSSRLLAVLTPLNTLGPSGYSAWQPLPTVVSVRRHYSAASLTYWPLATGQRAHSCCKAAISAAKNKLTSVADYERCASAVLHASVDLVETLNCASLAAQSATALPSMSNPTADIDIPECDSFEAKCGGRPALQ